ncbi:MAG: alpha/beta-type small acid-soluble spore protein [Syntrophomonas sp.]
MGRRRGLMSEQLKYEIARELGVDHIVSSEGWGAVSSRDCGNIVKKAIEIAERNVSSQYQQNMI